MNMGGMVRAWEQLVPEGLPHCQTIVDISVDLRMVVW